MEHSAKVDEHLPANTFLACVSLSETIPDASASQGNLLTYLCLKGTGGTNTKSSF
jgi:hypothetical protein